MGGCSGSTEHYLTSKSDIVSFILIFMGCIFVVETVRTWEPKKLKFTNQASKFSNYLNSGKPLRIFVPQYCPWFYENNNSILSHWILRNAINNIYWVGQKSI